MKVIIVLVSCFLGVERATAHGFMWDPPNRSSLWRFGYETPINYDDNQHYCGGIGAQLHGKFSCGICGDPYDDPIPRSNEHGGTYGLGIISRTYEADTLVSVVVNLETEHKGYFEFHLCNIDESGEESEGCFRTLLCENGYDRYYPQGSRFHNVHLRLPKHLKCEHCILRWHYKTGNNWGVCENGTEALGCGPQEVFRNCADVSIKRKKEI